MFKYPVKKIGITCDFGYPPEYKGGFHKGLDLGWWDYEGEPIYSVENGVVTAVGYSSDCGNYCICQYGDYMVRYLHMKQPSCVRAGQAIKQGDLVGYMGCTGYSFGTHLHIDFFRNGQYENPVDIMYAVEGQELSSKSVGKVKIYIEPKIVYVGIPTLRNEEIDQIEVINEMLNCRDDNHNILGYINKGIYNILDYKELNGYTWAKVECGWIAVNSEWNTIYKKVVKEEVVDVPKKEEPIIDENKPAEETKDEDSPINQEEHQTSDNNTKEEEITTTKSFIDLIIEIIKKIIENLRTR